MTQPKILAMAALLVVTAALQLPAVVSSSAAMLDGRDRNTIIQQRRWNDLEELNRIESRQRFQKQERQLRELDRQMNRPTKEQRPELRPIPRPKCPEGLFGSKAFAGSGCR